MEKKESIIRTVLRKTLFLRINTVTCATFFLALFAVLHLLGWRNDTTIISGTFEPKGASLMILRGVLYGVSYFAALIVSPILLLAAGIYTVLSRLLARHDHTPT